MGETEAGVTDRLWAGLIPTPCGPMIAVVDDHDALVRLDFFEHESGSADGRSQSWHNLLIAWDSSAISSIALQLEEYFAGKRRIFDLKLAPRGNAFLQRAWHELRQVPYGTTVSYGELARRLDPPTSARAIGRANAINPISVVVPCHRVIGANGQLTGYGGGVGRKAALLSLEGAISVPDQDALPLGSRRPFRLLRRGLSRRPNL